MKKYYPLILMVLLFSACSDFKGNEDSVVSSLAPLVCDNSTPSISEVSAIGTTTDTTPDYVFSSTILERLLFQEVVAALIHLQMLAKIQSL